MENKNLFLISFLGISMYFLLNNQKPEVLNLGGGNLNNPSSDFLNDDFLYMADSENKTPDTNYIFNIEPPLLPTNYNLKDETPLNNSLNNFEKKDIKTTNKDNNIKLPTYDYKTGTGTDIYGRGYSAFLPLETIKKEEPKLKKETKTTNKDNNIKLPTYDYKTGTGTDIYGRGYSAAFPLETIKKEEPKLKKETKTSFNFPFI